MTAATVPTERSSRFANPVLARELRQRMSTPRIVIVLTAYLTILGGALALLYRAQANTTSQFSSQPGISEFADIGQSLFEFVLSFMVLLVLFVVPGFTAASIAGERERQTLRALQVTLLSPLGIVSGKVAASIALTVLLLVASMPLLAVAYLVGGITFGEIFISLGILLFSATALACMTVACSALVKSVSGAILLAYGLVIALVIGSFAAYGIAGAYDSSRGVDDINVPSWILAVNPVAAIAEVSDRSPAGDPTEVVFGPFGPQPANSSSVESPLASIRDFINEGSGQRFADGFGFDDGFGVPIPIDPFGNPLRADVAADGPVASGDEGLISSTTEFLLAFSAIALIGVALATRRISTPARSDR